jgi:hypothetical protein
MVQRLDLNGRRQSERGEVGLRLMQEKRIIEIRTRSLQESIIKFPPLSIRFIFDQVRSQIRSLSVIFFSDLEHHTNL